MSCGKPCNCPTYLDHLRSISLQPSGPHPIELKDRQLSKDMDAYKELRRQGYQPKNIDGCAELQGKVSSQFELETGHLFTKAQMPEVREGIRIAREIEETGSSDGVVREVAP